MTQDQKAEIYRQNAQHSTGPKTEEGKAKVSQNAVTHGLTSSIPPLKNPQFMELLHEFIDERKPQTPSERQWVLELAHIAFKLKQIPSYEYEIELNSPLTPAQHFAQDKPTPLTRLWYLQLRLSARFDSLDRKLKTSASLLQNEPTPLIPSPSSTPAAYSLQPTASPQPLPPTSSLQSPASPTPDSLLKEMHDILRQNPGMAERLLQNPDLPDDSRGIIMAFLQNKPTASTPSASILQNKPNSTLHKLAVAAQSVPLTIPNPF